MTPWTEARQASLSITNYRSLLKLTSIESVMPSNHLLLCHPLLLLPSIFPSIRVFSKESPLRIGGQSTGVSASTSVLPMNIQDWFPLGWTGWVLLSKGLSRVFNTAIQKHQFFSSQIFYSPTLKFIHDYWKNHSLDEMELCWQSNVSAFNMPSSLVITFLPRSKCLLISWLQSPSAVILELR